LPIHYIVMRGVGAAPTGCKEYQNNTRAGFHRKKAKGMHCGKKEGRKTGWKINSSDLEKSWIRGNRTRVSFEGVGN